MRRDLEDAAEKDHSVKLEDILVPPIPAKKGKQAENKPCVITRLGRVVGVVDEDNM
jgi:hypothetical protein